MSKGNHTIYCEEATWELAQALSCRADLSVSELISEFIWYNALVESDRPITSKIRAMDPKRRIDLIKSLTKSVKEGKVMKPQAFKKAVQEAAEEYAKGIQDNVADSIIHDLENRED